MRKKSGRTSVTAEVAAEAISSAAEQVEEPTRGSLEEFLHAIADSDPKAALKCADKAIGILHQLTRAQQSTFLAEAISLIDLLEAASEFFLGCVDLMHYLDNDDLRSWVEQGRLSGLKNPQTAVAFFRQESQASISTLQRLRWSIHISEVGRLLQLYCTAIAGKPLVVKSTADAPRELVREGHLFPLTDGKAIYLPDQLNKHSSREDNFEEYKVLAAHQAGYIEYGTFTLDIDVLLDHSDFKALSPGNGDAASGSLSSHYEIFFSLFDDRQLACDVFFAIEDGRIDYRLHEDYQGLAVGLTKVALASLEGRPAPSSLPLREALVESLIRLSITGRIEESLPREVLSLYRHVCRIYSRVLNRGATVTDSAVAAARIYRMMRALPNVSLEAESCRTAVQKAEELLAEQPGKKARSDMGLPQAGFFDSTDQLDDSQPYAAALPVPYRGQTRPEFVQLETAIELLRDALSESQEEGTPLSAEMLKELLRRGVKIKISQATAKELADASGLFVTDLKGLLQEKVEKLSPEERKRLAKLLQQATVIKSETPGSEQVFYYDEWDYLIGDYRPRWCQLREIMPEEATGEIVDRIRQENAGLILSVRRHFQRIRPEMLNRVKRLRSGEEIEMDDAIESIIDRRTGLTPSDRIYQKRERRGRDVATAFLLDLSASTDEWVVEETMPRQKLPETTPRSNLRGFFSSGAPGEEVLPAAGAKRVIDVEREALVIMSEALESLDDEYAIYGFSGYGRDNVELVPVKEFSERYSEQTRRRIGALKPRKSTRMGPAIRHALERLAGTGRRLKVLILLSDGYPQDFDYGPDRTSREYGLHDTMVALQEARRKQVHTFCVTVDQAGNDYLREMCGGENYLVVKRPSALPKILPRVYRGLTV